MFDHELFSRDPHFSFFAEVGKDFSSVGEYGMFHIL